MAVNMMSDGTPLRVANSADDCDLGWFRRRYIRKGPYDRTIPMVSTASTDSIHSRRVCCIVDTFGSHGRSIPLGEVAKSDVFQSGKIHVNSIRSLRVRLCAATIGLASVFFASGCAASRWRFLDRTASRKTVDRTDEAIAGLQTKPHSGGGRKTNLPDEPSIEAASANGASDESTASTETGAGAKPVLIRRVVATDEQPSISDVVESAFAYAQPPENPLKNPTPLRRLQIPKELPGAQAPAVDLPPHAADDAVGREKDIAKNFGELPTVAASRVKSSGTGRNYTLDELQSLALASNPLMTQAEAQVMALRGSAIQAGLHPNPVLGYEGDTVGSNANPNYQGGYINTVIKTAGKLKLAESAANVDVWNADLMRKKARIELITQVRGAYFSALIARENVKVTEALVRFTDSVYQIQLDQLRGGLVSVYEPIQLRALAVQARTALNQARNRYDSAWRQLAATVGVPDMQIGELDGNPDLAIPAVDYDAALPYVLSNHTDVVAARNSEVQARINLRLQEVTPIPDLIFYTALQKDFTTAPVYRLTYNMQVGVPVPIFDKNQGNILNAHGTLMKASQEAARVQNELATRLADAVERYSNTSNIAQMYRDHILPDQARAYRGVYERHQQQPDLVGFADVVTAQQTLLMSIGVYINSLVARWQAFTDIGSLIQAESIAGIEAVLQNGTSIYEEPMIPPGPASE